MTFFTFQTNFNGLLLSTTFNCQAVAYMNAVQLNKNAIHEGLRRHENNSGILILTFQTNEINGL